MHWNETLHDEKHAFVPLYDKELLQYVNTNSDQVILDIGCGTGVLTNELTSNSAKVIGIDLSNSMLQKAQKKFPHIEFHLLDAINLPFDNQIDTVFSSSVFHWIHDQKNLLESIYRSLKPNGHLVCEFCAKNCLRTVWEALDDVMAHHGHPFVSPHFYPSVDEYEALIQNARLNVEMIRIYIRPTPLTSGRNGLRFFITQFLPENLAQLSTDAQDRVFAELESKLEPVLWKNDHWVVDYVRLQVVARK